MKITLMNAIKGSAMLLLAASVFVGTGCQKETQEPFSPEDALMQILEQIDQTKLNAQLAVIDDSLDAWGLTDLVEVEPNGVRYIIDSLGTGNKPTLGSPVRMKYSGKLLASGEEFDASNNAVFYLFELITGFQTTVPLFPVGTKATMYIPAVYGYGANDFRDNAGNVLIPGGSNLIFEIELLEIL